MQKVLITLLILGVLSCKTKQEITSEKPVCNTEGTVKDFTGLDGCKLLIVLDNGDKLLPAKVNDESFVLKDGQRIKFAYNELSDMMSICMAEKAAIQITCIEEIESPPPPQCHDIVDPEKVDWMNQIIQSQDIKTVDKYKYKENAWAYLFTNNARQLLYDCTGKKLCEFDGFGPNDCRSQKLSDSGRKNTIWRLGHIKQARD